MNAGAVILIIIVVIIVAAVIIGLNRNQNNPNAYQQCLNGCQQQDQACQAQYGQNSIYCQAQLGACNTTCSI